MLMKPLLATALSGSLGGLMATSGRSGTHLQLRGLRSNRGTQEQQVVRGAVAGLTASWESTLSEAQRESWRTYAANVAVTNRLGESRHTSGMMMFVRANVGRLQIQANRIDDAPVTFNRGDVTPPLVALAVSSIQIVASAFVGGPGADPWRQELGSFLLVFLGVPQNPGIQKYRGSYRLAGSIQGDPFINPASIVVTSPFRFAAGQRIFARHEVSYADGRYTVATFGSIIAF